MKLTREEFQRYIYSYNDDETFYKTLSCSEKEHPDFSMNIASTLTVKDL